MTIAVLIVLLLLDFCWPHSILVYVCKATKLVTKFLHLEEELPLIVPLVAAYLIVGGWFVLPVLLYLEIARIFQ
ncbi:hypothetical protein [Zavarzinella formosa]|uniref:hypothetical protein n=1 Tax=Zavarzinella formosa TaxID=360055 RepID=UPI0002D51955|nr:hypothetical protein [Zavarzinella formosa]